MRAKFGRGPTVVSKKGSLKFISRFTQKKKLANHQHFTPQYCYICLKAILFCIFLEVVGDDYFLVFYRNLIQPSTRRGVAFPANNDLGLTDIEMANDVNYSDGFYDDRSFEMEYEVRQLYSCVCCYGMHEVAS